MQISTAPVLKLTVFSFLLYNHWMLYVFLNLWPCFWYLSFLCMQYFNRKPFKSSSS